MVVFLFLQPPWFQRRTSRDELLLEQYEEVVEAERYAVDLGRGAVRDHERQAAGGQRHRSATATGRRARLLDDDKVVWVGLLTSVFLHAGMEHLLGNMLFLWVFGNNVEDRLGHLAYLALYLVGGVVAALGFVLANQHSVVPGIGASGAIAAVMGAYLVFRPRGKILTRGGHRGVPGRVRACVRRPRPVLRDPVPHPRRGEAIAWEAHAAGMAFGMVAALLLARLFPDPAVRLDARRRHRGSSF